MKSFKKPTNDQRGFTYVMVMFFIVMMGISLMAIGQEWSVTMKRDREAELLFRGTRIQKAIERYATDYQVQKSTRPNQYPLALKDLTKKPKRFLQAVYKDPITGKDFELIKTGGQIRGVRSTSQDKPYNQVKFKDAKTYHAIRFEAKASTGCDLSNPDPFSCPKGNNTGTENKINPETGKPFETPQNTKDTDANHEETPIN